MARGAWTAQESMVTPGRLELPTRSLGNCCSIHLSYGATVYNQQLTRFVLFSLVTVGHRCFTLTSFRRRSRRRHEMMSQKSRYQQGSITRITRASGYAWRVRSSEWNAGNPPALGRDWSLCQRAGAQRSLYGDPSRPDRRRASSCRPCAHNDIDSPEVHGGADGGRHSEGPVNWSAN